MQVEAMNWSQPEEGQDLYEATEDVIAVPPIFSLPVGETQTVRVGLLTGQPTDYERSYRLFLTELPPPRDPDAPPGLRMRMRVSIPMFAAPLLLDESGSPVEPESSFRIVGVEEQEELLRVRLHNPGLTHVRVSELAAMAGFEAQPRPGAGYVLAGSYHDFLIKVPADFNPDRIRAVADSAGVREYELVPDK